MAAKNILIGLGNPILSDDGIGLVVATEVHRRLPGFDLDMSCWNGLDVVDRIVEYEAAVIIDSMITGQHRQGEVVRFDLEEKPPTLRSRGSHGAGLDEAIRTARSYHAAVPPQVVIYGIEVSDPFSVGEKISPALLAQLDAIAEKITLDILAELGRGPREER